MRSARRVGAAEDFPIRGILMLLLGAAPGTFLWVGAFVLSQSTGLVNLRMFAASVGAIGLWAAPFQNPKMITILSMGTCALLVAGVTLDGPFAWAYAGSILASFSRALVSGHWESDWLNGSFVSAAWLFCCPVLCALYFCATQMVSYGRSSTMRL
jgi:hypothetical protein